MLVIKNKLLIPEYGKCIRRIYDNKYYSSNVIMGNTYYINGVLQNPPHKDTVDDFEEVDIPDWMYELFRQLNDLIYK